MTEVLEPETERPTDARGGSPVRVCTRLLFRLLVLVLGTRTLVHQVRVLAPSCIYQVPVRLYLKVQVHVYLVLVVRSTLVRK